MNQRDHDEKKPLMDGIFDLFARKSAQTNMMQQVVSITEQIVPKGPTIEEQIKQIQDHQQIYLWTLLIQFGISLIVIGIVKYFELTSYYDLIPFIIWTVLLVVYILSIALAQFSESASQKQPKNVFLFIISSIARLFWLTYAVALYPDLHLDVLLFMIFLNMAIVAICFRLDQADNIHNCLLVSDQPWRISFVILFEILFVGLYLNIQDAPSALVWILVLFFVYCYILMNGQMVEFRRHLFKNGNSFFLAHLYFDGDIVFPCFFLQHHLLCTTQRSILR